MSFDQGFGSGRFKGRIRFRYLDRSLVAIPTTKSEAVDPSQNPALSP